MKRVVTHLIATALAALLIAAALVLSLSVAGPRAAGQEASTPEQEVTTLKVAIDVVNVYAVVREKKGRLIPNLSREDFELREDKVPQEVRYFAREADTPLTMGVAIDTSVSQERVLPVEQQEAKRFLRQVMHPKDLAFVLHFDMEVELLQDFTGDVRRLERAIDETVIRAPASGPLPTPLPTSSVGGTHLYDAVYLAAHDLLKGEVGRKVLIVLSDGVDQGSQVELDAALEAAQKADIIIYCLDASDPSFYWRRDAYFGGTSVLKKLARETGGRVIEAGRPEKTAQAFQEIAEELRTQYLLGYSPANPRRDGGFRKIEVKVRGRDYKVQARRGYYAPAE